MSVAEVKNVATTIESVSAFEGITIWYELELIESPKKVCDGLLLDSTITHGFVTYRSNNTVTSPECITNFD